MSSKLLAIILKDASLENLKESTFKYIRLKMMNKKKYDKKRIKLSDQLSSSLKKKIFKRLFHH